MDMSYKDIIQKVRAFDINKLRQPLEYYVYDLLQVLDTYKRTKRDIESLSFCVESCLKLDRAYNEFNLSEHIRRGNPLSLVESSVVSLQDARLRLAAVSLVFLKVFDALENADNLSKRLKDAISEYNKKRSKKNPGLMLFINDKDGWNNISFSVKEDTEFHRELFTISFRGRLWNSAASVENLVECEASKKVIKFLRENSLLFIDVETGVY